MPITIKGTTDSRVGHIASTLGTLSANLDGTNVAPPNRVGSMNPTLGSLQASLQGQFASAGTFDGQLDLSFEGLGLQLFGNQIQTLDGQVTLAMGGLSMLMQDTAAAQLDFNERTVGSVWFHNFVNEAEVNQFRWTSGSGNDPNDVFETNGRDNGTVNWLQGDGVSGGACLNIITLAGTSEPKNWWRPFSPMSGADNGRGVADPADFGEIALAAFDSSDPDETREFDAGWYGNAFDSADPAFDGGGYWFQTRIKLDPQRPLQPSAFNQAGKLFYFTITDFSNSAQEIVTKSQHNGSTVGDEVFYLYRSGGIQISPTQANRESSELVTNPEGYWQMPYNETWITIMYHVRPETGNNTYLQVWTDYDGTQVVGKFIKLWDDTVPLPFDVRNGHNALIASCYLNKSQIGVPTTSDVFQRFDEMIFSKYPVACPNSIPTTLQLAARGLSAGQWVDFTKNLAQAGDDGGGMKWMTRPIHYDPFHKELQVATKDAGGTTNWYHYRYRELDDVWENLGTQIESSNGHVWLSALDPVTGDYYINRGQGGDRLRIARRQPDGSFTYENRTIPLSGSPDNVGALVYHPNAFGQDRPGIYIWGRNQHIFYDIENDSFASVGSTTGTGADDGPTWNIKNGTGDYIRGFGAVIAGGKGQMTGSNRRPMIAVYDGAGLSSDAEAEGTIVYLGEAPIVVWGAGDTTNHVKLSAHPSNPDKVIFCEGGASTDDRFFWSDDLTPKTHPYTGGSLQSYIWTQDGRHPFHDELSPNAAADQYCIGRISEYGTLIGMSSGGTSGDCILWKPPD